MGKNVEIKYETRTVKFSQVKDNPDNARKIPKDEKGKAAYERGIKDLSDDIKVNGNIQPMTVILTDDPETPYQVKEGSRRWAAFSILEPEYVDVRIIPFAGELDQELIGLAGNLDREDLRPYEIAARLAQIKDEHPDAADNTIATRIGRSKSYVQNLLRMYNGLHPKVLKEWENGHGMATTDNLGKLVKIEDKDEQWDRWRVLCGDIEEGGDDGDDDEGGEGEEKGAPKRNAKKAAGQLLAAILADKTMKEKQTFAVQCLQYVVGARKTVPAGIDLDPRGQRAGKGDKAA